MAPFKICVVGECSCAQMIVMTEYLEERLAQAGYSCKVSRQSIWENPDPPRFVNLVLETGPHFTEEEVGCPVLNIQPLLRDHHDPTTIDNIINHVKTNHFVI